MAAPHSNRLNLTVVLVSTVAALVGRAWLQRTLLDNGTRAEVAADLSYLIVPPVLLILLFPIWRRHYAFIARLFRRDALTIRRILNAVAIGCLLRLAAWAHLIAGVSFGWFRSTDPNAVVGPILTFRCGDPHVLALGIIVMVLLVPVVEETINRGLVQSWLAHRGAPAAILLSASIFMLMHRPSSWPFAFFAGLVFGIQFWQTKTLWCSLITHATINGLIQIDWRCLNGHWNPPASQLPNWTAGITSITVLMSSVLWIILLLRGKSAGGRFAPRQ